MKLNNAALKDREQWIKAGYILPEYDREEVCRKTVEKPEWVHFGAGNIFRAFQANLAQKMLNEGFSETGIVVVEGFDYEIIEKQYRPHDDLTVLVTLKADGDIEKTIIGSIGESCILDSQNEEEFSRLKEIFASESLKMVTFTITEKGYSLVNGAGEIQPQIEADFAAGPEKPMSYIGKVASLLYTRYLAGGLPIAMVSTDNCSHNGDKLYAAVNAFAEGWVRSGRAEPEFASYIKDGSRVSFPWSMIDKITPRPDDSVRKLLEETGLEDLEPVITSKHTYVAPFVNAEESEYLVIEDDFPNGRPALEKVGVIFTDRDTVNKVERMKVCTCLNPLHTALAVYGCLLGYDRISEEMKDPELRALVDGVGYREGLPVVTDPGVIAPKEFIDTVLNVRIPNPFMPDTPQRIATDTSQKLSIRFGETIKAYRESAERSVDELHLIPLVLAGWLRYLMAVDDTGKAFTPSPDPLLERVGSYVKGFELGRPADRGEIAEALAPLQREVSVFGVDLIDVGLADRVTDYFAEMIEGPGAVRRVLKKYV